MLGTIRGDRKWRQFFNFLTRQNIWMNELGEIGVFHSGFWREKFENFANAIDNLVRNV